jgi:phosphoribosyl-AMP cyclohydrolase
MNRDEGLALALDFAKQDGLLPVVVQDAQSRAVLMLAYVNEAALHATQETGFAHYYSRSRDRLWKKGETSGHVQRVVEVLVDCDQDTLLYLVEQTGPACHTYRSTCFYRRLDGAQLTWLNETCAEP